MKKVNFTYLPEYILDTYSDNYYNLRACASTISYCWSTVICDVRNNFVGTLSQKRRIVSILNCILFSELEGDSFTYKISFLDTFDSPYDDDDLRKKLGSLYVDINKIVWDVELSHEDSVTVNNTSSTDTILSKSDITTTVRNVSKRSDLSFEFCKYPSIDTSKVWAFGKDDGGRLIPIYTTLPEIPTVQNEISITTDESKMSSTEFMNLYPDHIIHTRRPEMYDKLLGYEYDELVGFIPKISGFSTEDIVDNIIKYPQFNYMYREVDGKRISFMKHIEIDGKLLSLKRAIECIDDMKNLPDNKVYYWDYIVRRYLLERDKLNIHHNYPLLGYFEPWMTLFAPPDVYIKHGYLDVEEMARKCVHGRILFYQSRNPLVRRIFE